MSFELRVTVDAIRDPTPLNLTWIEAAMLWPSDPVLRDQWERAGILADGRRFDISDMPRAIWQQYADDLRDAPRQNDRRPADWRAWVKGQRQGMVLLDALGGEPMTSARKRRAEIINEQMDGELRAEFHVSAQTLANERQVYRAVEHLWAAYALEVQTSGSILFPCEATALGEFLGTAEAIREIAENIRAPRSREPLMRAGDVVVIPDDVRAILPRVRLHLAPG